MPVERKIIGTDANGNPIYQGDPPPPAPPAPSRPVQTSGGRGTGGGRAVGAPPGDKGDLDQSVGGGPPHDVWDFGSFGSVKKSAIQSVTDPKGFVTNLLGMGGSAPDNYDATGELAKSEAMAGDVYGQAMAQSQAAARGAPSSTVTAQQLAQPGQLTAQTIGTPDTLAGMQASDLRAQQLAQAAAAADSPSAAAAQMRGAAGLISNQQLGQAAMARGADRAAARRDAMLATGTQGMVAANQSAALAASELAAKQAAYTQALTGVRAGDVSAAQAQTQIGAANQAADLQAQNLTEANRLEAAKANQAADLDASKYTAGNNLDAWTASQQAQNASNATAIQAVGAQNQAQGVAANYGTGKNEADAKKQAGLIGAGGAIVGGLLSDERAKTDVYQIDQPKAAEPYDFLDWQPEAPEKKESSPGLLGGILGAISDERVKTDAKRLTAADETADLLRSAYGITDDGNPYGAALSDERTKREVDRMAPNELVNWAEDVPMATFRYKPDAPGTDGGEDYHLGTLAQSLERTGPMGRLMVHERDDGLKEVDYGPLALAIAKAALVKAGQKGGR